ncbi:hypothetical protein GQ53DRAFT_343793 [Thozetella sp. PMI_491]|nr:hypothetical protein GQ53DRAFT_343793 [Thozetella sp. PMI_491]
MGTHRSAPFGFLKTVLLFANQPASPQLGQVGSQENKQLAAASLGRQRLKLVGRRPSGPAEVSRFIRLSIYKRHGRSGWQCKAAEESI